MKPIPTFLALLCLLCDGLRAAETGRPNILFLLSDDHSYPFLSCYRDGNVKTPNLDRLAAEGMDGRLSKAEFSAGRAAAEAEKWFGLRDADGDGFVSREEFLPAVPAQGTR